MRIFLLNAEASLDVSYRSSVHASVLGLSDAESAESQYPDCWPGSKERLIGRAFGQEQATARTGLKPPRPVKRSNYQVKTKLNGVHWWTPFKERVGQNIYIESEMGTETRVEDSSRVAAKKWLDRELRDVFVKTSTDCRRRLEELPNPFICGEGIFEGDGTAGDFVVRESIKRWKEQLVGAITKGFKLFCVALARGPQYDEEHPIDIAEKLTWETIDDVFHWTNDMGNSKMFKEWWSLAAYTDLDNVSQIDPSNWQAAIAEALSSEFQDFFKQLLEKLRLEALIEFPPVTASLRTPPTSAQDDTTRHDIDNAGPLRHTEGYRSIYWNTQKYDLSKRAAKIVEILCEFHPLGVGEAEIMKRLGTPDSRIRDSFKSVDAKKLWKTLIVSDSRGVYSLNLRAK